jgi:putative ABC transport system permease protein
LIKENSAFNPDNQIIMQRYNLITSFRSIKRNLSFSLINISGLSLGLSLVILLLAWLQFEFSFDGFHLNANRIFRVVVEFKQDISSDNFAETPAPLGEVLKNEIPEVQDFVRFGSFGRILVRSQNEQFWENIELADPSIFKIFSFKLVSGNPETALGNPGSIILSENRARKYFGNKNPLGQILLIGDNKTPHTVTGVLKDIPANSQLRFDFLGSFSEIKNNLSWGNWNYTTYILAKNDESFPEISGKLPAVVKKISERDNYQLHIQPLRSIHLHSRLRDDLNTNRDINTVYIMSSILILVLVLGCVNYMNLATARYTTRGRETSLRKIAGATSSNLAGQFIFESFAITLFSFIIALFLSYLLLPVFNSMTGVRLEIQSLFNLRNLFKFIFLVIIITLIAGSYPAYLLSSINPVAVLRDDFALAGVISIKTLRKGFVIFQFLISIILISCTLIIKSQMTFIKNRNLGLISDQIVVVPIYQSEVKPKYELYKKEILKSPYILNATAVAYFTGNQGYNQNVWWEGLQENDNSNMMSWIPVDEDFIKTLGIKLVKGENFSEKSDIMTIRSYILNESAAKMTGWDDPIGKKFSIVGPGKVIGIVKDFNFKSLYSEIEPVALVSYPAVFDNLMIKISSEDRAGSINILRNTWNAMFSEAPFEFSFFSDDIHKIYNKENSALKLITYASVFSLCISCIGLLGLVLFTIDNRLREIGIRKVAGSSSKSIVLMLNREFAGWITVSFVLSCPVIIYFMRKWLENFAYRESLNWWILLFAGSITIIISLLTVSWLTWKASIKNPVECLKQE